MSNLGFITYLRKELEQYHQMADSRSSAKLEKKAYINGLMQASRFFNISFEELKLVIDEANETKMPISVDEELLDIPTVIRNNKTVIVD